MKSVYVGVRVPESLYKDLQRMQRDGHYRSVSEVLRTILSNHLARIAETRDALDAWREQYRGMKYTPLTPEERDALAMELLRGSKRRKTKAVLAARAKTALSEKLRKK
jgi:Arc/MetJ-type ribon-helix-helix transcriptional regulator